MLFKKRSTILVLRFFVVQLGMMKCTDSFVSNVSLGTLCIELSTAFKPWVNGKKSRKLSPPTVLNNAMHGTSDDAIV